MRAGGCWTGGWWGFSTASRDSPAAGAGDGWAGPETPEVPAAEPQPARGPKLDLHTHYYPEAFFQKIRETPGDFRFDKDPTGRTIIKYRGARFFGIQPPMTDVAKRLEDMDRVGIDVEVISL